MANVPIVPLNRSGLIPLARLERLVAHVKSGGCITLPADTCNILVVDALNEAAVRNLYRIKQRASGKPIHVCVATMAQARELAEMGEMAERLLKSFTPGPITVIARKKEIVPDILVANTGSIGVRIPDSPCILQFCSELGRPITATSANISDEEILSDCEAIVDTFGDALGGCVQANGFEYGSVSTIVRVGEDGGVDFLRDGPISRDAILDAAKSANRDAE